MKLTILSLLFPLLCSCALFGQNAIIPGHVIDFPGLQANPLTDAGACAATGGCGSGVPHGTYTSSYSAYVDSLTVSINPAAPFDNFYLYQNLSRQQFAFNAPLLGYLGITFSVSDLSKCQAFELDPQIVEGGAVYNGGIQFLTSTGGTAAVRYFNYANKTWNTIPNITPFPDVTKPVVVQEAMTFDPTNHTVTIVSLTINGTWYGVSIPLNYVPNVYPSTAFSLSMAFQLDSNNSGQAYSATVSGFHFTLDKQ